VTTFTITNASEGTTLVSSGGTLTAIRWILGPTPGQVHSVLALVDDAAQPAKTLWRQDVGCDATVAPKYSDPNRTVNWTDQTFTGQWALPTNGNIAFAGHLTVASVPVGGEIRLARWNEFDVERRLWSILAPIGGCIRSRSTASSSKCGTGTWAAGLRSAYWFGDRGAAYIPF
jgi:hypothetical protein